MSERKTRKNKVHSFSEEVKVMERREQVPPILDFQFIQKEISVNNRVL